MTSTFPSAQTEADVGVTRSIGQQGMNDVLSGNTSRLIPSKRRYSDLDGTRDFFGGESSRIGAQAAGRAQQTLGSSQPNTNTNNNLIASSNRNELPNSDHFQSETSRNVRPFSNIQNPVGEVQSIESNFNLQTTATVTVTATPPLVILPATRRLSNIHHTWGLQLPLTNTSRPFFQSRRAPFISSLSSTPNGSTSSVQPVLYAPHIISSVNAHPLGRSIHYETISGAIPPFINHRIILDNVMHNNPRIGTGDHQYYDILSGAVSQFLNQRNIHENVMRINPRIGTGNQDNGPGIMGLAIGTPYQFGSYNNISPPNAQTRVTGSTQQRFWNHPGTQGNSQELDLSLALGHSGTVNEGNSVARFETQAYNNSVPFLTRMLRVPEPRSNLRWVNTDDQVNIAISILEAALQHQRVGHLQYEDVIQFARNLEELIERHAVTQEQNDVANIGLTEEDILKYIKRENFEFVGEDTPENREKCCICQATYTNGEEVGKLDCVHRFHVDCIKQWLVIKNICPVCKQTALAIDENDE
ncbi:hypothetical protein Lal_00027344 [Lupinus albus]|nr:hypothetical protein Lal_00027344 [Lupinus albus]